MTAVDVGVLILRVCLGLTMAAHGYNKFTGGGKIAGTAAWFDGIGMKPGLLHARLAAISELGFGLALAVGLFTPVAAAGFVALMLVAAWTVHRYNGFFIVREGWEYNLVLAVGAVAVAVLGPGLLSVDEVIFGSDRVGGWWGFAIAAGVGLAAGVAQLAIFYRPPVR
ncbi:DoxX family protein [Nocardia cyriacigeorgica]|uniref:DoxX family protein n=1 Tax=Nocardia cyriacigeorgica TaxID=135487 RepID=A0A5R8P9E5_9NOCA|nr:DoxX family protein [Nocardia cyriacigeorgica]TLF98263.1 DoxX family protein [Nocardia cyriacigeorgica]